MAPLESTTWVLRLDRADSPMDSIDWQEVMHLAKSRESGHLSAKRIDGQDEVSLLYNEYRGLLEYAQTDDGPVFHPVFVHRALPPDELEIFECGGCGIPLEYNRSSTVAREDAFALLREFLRSGQLPTQIPEKPLQHKQLMLPGLEEYVIPDLEWRTVAWRKD